MRLKLARFKSSLSNWATYIAQHIMHDIIEVKVIEKKDNLRDYSSSQAIAIR